MGSTMVMGTFTMSSSYATNGDTLNLSNVLKSAGSPMVLINPTNTVTMRHNAGTASAGKVLAYVQDINGAEGEVANATDLSSINVTFIAIGADY
jgi:hypothetical protein